MIGTKPYALLRYREIYGKRMAFIDEGKGDVDRPSAWTAQRHLTSGAMSCHT